MFEPKGLGKQSVIVGDSMIAQIITRGRKNHVLQLFFVSSITNKLYRVRKDTRYKYRQSAIRYALGHVI